MQVLEADPHARERVIRDRTVVLLDDEMPCAGRLAGLDNRRPFDAALAYSRLPQLCGLVVFVWPGLSPHHLNCFTTCPA